MQQLQQTEYPSFKNERNFSGKETKAGEGQLQVGQAGAANWQKGVCCLSLHFFLEKATVPCPRSRWLRVIRGKGYFLSPGEHGRKLQFSTALPCDQGGQSPALTNLSRHGGGSYLQD
jgi:hypothetical protein